MDRPGAKVDLPLVVPEGALGAVAGAARLAESEGFDGVTASEITSDPLLQLTVAAGVTERVDLMTNIAVAFARSPMTVAVQGRALQDYSHGRLTLGLGSQIKAHIERRYSMRWGSPAARMTEYVGALRAIWSAWESGEKLDFRGEFYTHTLMTPMFTPPSVCSQPRVLLAAVGERMTEAAGAVADGLILHPFSTPHYVSEVSLASVRRGRESSQTDRDFEIYASPFLISGRDETERAEAERRVRDQLAFYGSTPAYRGVLDLHGWGGLGDKLHAISTSSDPRRWRQMGDAIPDDVLREFAVIEEPAHVGRALHDRWRGLATRYAINSTSVRDPLLAALVGHGLRDAAAQEGQGS